MARVSGDRILGAPPDAVWRTVGDPRHLARWWPKVQRVEAVEGMHFTEVLQTDRGRGVRADWTIVESVEPQRWSAEQEVEGTPFENVLQAARRHVVLQPAGAGDTAVTITVERKLRGVSRLSGFMMRGATSRQVEEALDNLVLLHGEARIGEPGRAS
jgi:uncharacterized protein YndB with AHSA1/START domain